MLLLLLLTVLLVGLVFFFVLKPPPLPPKLDLDFDSIDVDAAEKRYIASVPPAHYRKIAVIGVGSLGTNLIERLLQRGEEDVVAIDVCPLPPSLQGRTGLRFLQVSILDEAELTKALEGAYLAYMTAALVRYWQRLPHQYAAIHAVNVTGTENVLNACKKNGVQFLVYTSTSHVSMDPYNARLNMTEEDRSEHPITHYGRTKLLGDDLVLKANGSALGAGRGTLRTVSVRPCSGIFGANDRIILQRKLADNRTVMFSNDYVVDYVYQDNVVLGLLLAAAKLVEEAAGKMPVGSVSGQAFCISNDEPMTHMYFNRIIIALAPNMEKVMLNDRLVDVLAAVSEAVQVVGKGAVSLGDLDLLTPATIAIQRMSYTFDISKAKRVLGYRPAYSCVEAVKAAVLQSRGSGGGLPAK